MKKTRLTFIFALLATAGAWAQTFTVDNLKYTVADADAGTVELIGYKEQPTGKLVIPSTVTCDGTDYSVTRIGNEAFGFCYNLTGITIPEGVTHMGFGAFQYCTSLEQVAIPEGVTSIENWTFGYCSALTEMTIPGSVTSIGDNAFYKCVSLDQVTIPESVTSFGKDAFRSCTLLTQMTIPDGVTSIGEGAFRGCTSLTQMIIPNSVTSIGNWTFEGCTSLKQVSISSAVSSIGYGTFQSCPALEQITIPDAVTSIGKYAFLDCSALAQVTMGSGVRSLEEGAFLRCSALMRMTVRAAVPPTVAANTFKNVSRTIPVYVPVESLDAYKAADVWKEFRVKGLPFVVDNLEYCVTDNTAKTAEVIGYVSQPTGTLEIPAYVTYEDAAYSVTDIGDKAFYKSSSFEEVIFSDNVANIGENAFGGCSALMRMTVRAAVPPTVGTMAFEDVNRTIPVYVPAESLAAYQAAYVWKDFTALRAIGSTGLDTPSMPESISVYGGMLHNPEGLRVTLYDLAGRIAYDGRAAIVELPAGVYVVRCNGATGKAVF